MIRLVSLLLLVLSACNTAGPHFRGLPATRVTVDGSTFDVRVRDNRAEAMRLNRQYAPRFGPIRGRAGKAMALVSGCEVTRVDGDQALATGALDCGNGPPQIRNVPAVELECIPLRGSEVKEVGSIRVDLECS